MQLLATGIQRASKESQVLVGALALAFASWDLTLTGEDLSTNNFTSYNMEDEEAYDEGIYGFLKVEGRFGGDWDAGANPLDTPPGLYIRDDLADLAMVVSRLDVTEWDFPYFRVRSAHNSSAVGGGGGKVAFDVSGINQGAFIPPQGSV